MKTLLDIWKWFNGKKTVIASVITLTVAFLQNKGVIDPDTSEYLIYLCTLLLGGSIGHKVKKGLKK